MLPFISLSWYSGTIEEMRNYGLRKNIINVKDKIDMTVNVIKQPHH